MNESDKELIELVNKGDSEAFIKLLDKFELMLYSIINSYGLEYGDYVVSKEDLFQEGCIALLEACKSFSDTYGAKFSTYAYVVIERKIQRAFYRYLKPYKEEYSFDKIDHFDYVKYAVADNGINYLDIKSKEEELINSLNYITDEDRQIIHLRLAAYSYKEIAEILHISPKRVDNRISRIRKFYRKNQKQ